MYEIDQETILIDVDEIKVGVNITNIRTLFDEEGIRDLAESIYEDGLLNPLIVMETEDDDGEEITELVCGSRRLQAIKLIIAEMDEDWGDGQVKVTQFTGSVEDAELVNGVENIERQAVDDVDTAAWLFRLTETGGHSQNELAKKVHRSPQWVSSRITFHRRACQELKDALREGLVRFSTAYEMAKRMSEEDQKKRIKKAKQNEEGLITLKEDKTEGTDTVTRPTKTARAKMLGKAEEAAKDEANRNAHGIAMALRWVDGLASTEELEEALTWKGEEKPGEPEEEEEEEEDE